jgi:hypothetical protein
VTSSCESRQGEGHFRLDLRFLSVGAHRRVALGDSDGSQFGGQLRPRSGVEARERDAGPWRACRGPRIIGPINGRRTGVSDSREAVDKTITVKGRTLCELFSRE